MHGIKLITSDPAYTLFKDLQNRNKLSPLSRADKTFDLLVILHKTSTSERPKLNGNSRTFIQETLGISKSLLSQYLSIHRNITSPKVKSFMQETALAVRPSYLVSLVRGKNLVETEVLQLEKVHELTVHRKITNYHKRRGVKM